MSTLVSMNLALTPQKSTLFEFAENCSGAHRVRQFAHFAKMNATRISFDRRPINNVPGYASSLSNITLHQHFAWNTPLQLVGSNRFRLDCDNHNRVFWNPTPSGNQWWMLERGDAASSSSVYIRSATTNQYIGCPNQNQRLYLYTSKTRFTAWNLLVQPTMQQISLTYTGPTFDPREIHLVVARYNEDLDWVLPYADVALVYNKGDPTTCPPGLHIENVANVGREGHTYLHHMVTRYGNLAKRTIFLQADWFPHNPTILYGIDNYDQHLPVQPMGLVYLQRLNYPPIEVQERLTVETNYGLKYMVLKVDENHDYYPDENYFYDVGTQNHIRLYREENPSNQSIFETFLSLANFPMDLNPLPTDIVPFTFCALFSVCKENIQLYGPSVYSNLMQELTRLCSQGGTNGYILERLWLWIFQYSLKDEEEFKAREMDSQRLLEIRVQELENKRDAILRAKELENQRLIEIRTTELENQRLAEIHAKELDFQRLNEIRVKELEHQHIALIRAKELENQRLNEIHAKELETQRLNEIHAKELETQRLNEIHAKVITTRHRIGEKLHPRQPNPRKPAIRKKK